MGLGPTGVGGIIHDSYAACILSFSSLGGIIHDSYAACILSSGPVGRSTVNEAEMLALKYRSS